MEANYTENFSFCKPCYNDSGDYALVMFDGELSAIKTPDLVAYRYDGTLTDEVMQQFAKAVNPNYDLYSGYNDIHIALEAMHPVGCAYCPFKDDCEIMGEEISEPDNR